MPSTPRSELLIDRARRRFRELTGAEPTLAAIAPGRVNLIGEHTDYNDGFVLPIAIDRSCVCVGGVSRDRGASRLVSADRDGVVTVNWCDVAARPADVVASLPESGAWARYVIGSAELVRRHVRTLGGPELPPLDLVIASDVPLGSGLSSSAALEMSVACVMEQHAGRPIAPLDRARLCRQAEHEFAGVPCGLMDQYASAFGKAGRAILLDCRSETHRDVPMPPTDDHGAAIVVVNSNVRHDLASGAYAQRRDACRRAATMLGRASLRDVRLTREDEREALLMLPAELERIVMHVVFESARAERFAALAEDADAGRMTWKRALPELGQLMLRSHASLRDNYQVSCPELDTLVELAAGVRGVYGARMTGGGFGGCIIALVRPMAVDRLIETLEAEYPPRHQRLCTCFAVQASDGARHVPLT